MIQVRDTGLDADSMHTALLIVNLDSALDLPVSMGMGMCVCVCVCSGKGWVGRSCLYLLV